MQQPELGSSGDPAEGMALWSSGGQLEVKGRLHFVPSLGRLWQSLLPF